MDPISQAALGAVCASTMAQKEDTRRFLAVGALSAMSADLDIFIRSAKDPLLNLEFHRHFTHSLIFIPLGALICSWVLSFVFREHWKKLYLPAFLGYMTAAPLDALTSYGTHLFWPFTNERSAFNVISIVDPIYTLTLLTLLCICFIKPSKRITLYALIFAIAYHCIGLTQRFRAEDLLAKTAITKNITPERIWAQPSLGNLLVWRGVIETKKKYYIYGIRTGLDKQITEAKICDRYFLRKDKSIKQDSILAEDIRRFTFFSSGFVSRDHDDNQLLTDIRYSPLPWTLNPLWALVINEGEPHRHAPVKYFRNHDSIDKKLFIDSILGKGVFSP